LIGSNIAWPDPVLGTEASPKFVDRDLRNAQAHGVGEMGRHRTRRMRPDHVEMHSAVPDVPEIAYLEARFDAGSVAALVVLRTLPSPFLAVNVGCGAAGVPWRTFVIGSGLGLVSITAAHTFFAAQLYAGVEGASLTALLWAMAGGAVIVGLALVPKLLKRGNRGPPAP
jgi:hypothetical protein